MRRLTAILLCLMAPLAASRADVPVRTEELVWSVIAFNGWDYSAAISPAAVPTVWLMAGVDNAVSLRKTFVYWWPLTSEWMTDSPALNVPLPGTLELRPTGRSAPVRRLALDYYTYFNVRGEYELNWRVATGLAAAAEVDRYRSLAEGYQAALAKYQEQAAAWEAERSRLVEAIRALQSRSGDASALLAELAALREPQEPAVPSYYASPPSPLQQGFIVNLPEGTWDARLVTPDGFIVEGSERCIVSWQKSGSGGIGYEVIPSDKWTRAEQSTTPSSVLYVNGTADLYLQPFFEDEVNDLRYEKTLSTNGRGNEGLLKWVRIQQVPNARLEVSRKGAGPELVTERPYFVQQAEGATLGYTIVPFDPYGAHKGQGANLKAFKIPVSGASGSMRVRTLDEHGTPISGSSRELRIVRGLPLASVCLGLVFVPLAAMVVVVVVRSRRYRR
jgi:hypothetical protein